MVDYRDIFEEKLIQHLTGDGISLSPATVQMLRGPCVYVFVKDGKALYVGMSKRGILRGIDERHTKGLFERSDEFLLFPAKSLKDAMEIERLLIASLAPEFNIKGNTHKNRKKISLELQEFAAKSRRFRKIDKPSKDKEWFPNWKAMRDAVPMAQ